MNSDYGGFILLAIAGIALSYLAFDTYVNGEVEPVKSTVDGRTYIVRSLPDKQDAANLLAEIRERCVSLVTHLNKSVPEDPRTQRLVNNFNPDSVSEGKDTKGRFTSYSINKGEKIILCLRARNKDNTLEDVNTMMFVTIHELAHICTVSIGHTDEFWENFKWLLEQSVDMGIYVQVDYKKDPQDYCGIKITSNPLN